MSRATKSVSRTRPAELSSSLASLRFATAPTSRLASARTCKWAHLAPCQNNNDQRSEKRLIETLKNVDAHGDVAPPHVHDPMTMVLRGNAIQAHSMQWDDARGRFALTGAGRRRISARGRAPGTILSFRKHDVFGSGLQHRKPARSNLKE